MLPAGKYVVEVVVPPGYELVKEEDKNILIGDNFIAPVTQEFGGLGQPSSSFPTRPQIGAAYNANNAQNPTQSLGRTNPARSHEGDTGTWSTFWPCVGASRIVPDYISLFPQSQEVAPFAGATRNLCDRKEVTLDDQTAALAKFYIFTSTHVAAHFTGVITDDFTSEFDPFSPQFGEKFSPPNMPVSIKDWTGTEISRVYSDQWGAYNGLTYSTWEVNPPNPTGYAPTMMVTCMNDPGTGTTPDPLFNPAVQPVLLRDPVHAWADPVHGYAGRAHVRLRLGAGTTIPTAPTRMPRRRSSEVDGDGVGPWVSAAGHDPHDHRSGRPDRDQQRVLRTLGHNGSVQPEDHHPPLWLWRYRHGTIGTHCSTATSVTSVDQTRPSSAGATPPSLATVPTGVPHCAVQQQAQYGGSTAQCGELVITAANGKQSIDTVTVTIGGKAPTRTSRAMRTDQFDPAGD